MISMIIFTLTALLTTATASSEPTCSVDIDRITAEAGQAEYVSILHLYDALHHISVYEWSMHGDIVVANQRGGAEAQIMSLPERGFSIYMVVTSDQRMTKRRLRKEARRQANLRRSYGQMMYPIPLFEDPLKQQGEFITVRTTCAQ